MTRICRATALVTALLVCTPGHSWAQELDTSSLSYDQMVGDASERIDRIETILSDVIDLRDETEREEQDLTRVRCVNDKIAAIQGFLRLSADSRDSLGEHSRRDDREAVEHQYTLVVIASQRVHNLQNEATQCAGDILTFSGDTEQSLTIDPEIPEKDTTDDDLADAQLERLVPETPLPEVTPFQ